jgi:hypothetical protein
MKDHEVIAHQARKIVGLEVKVARGVESERQLLEILRNAGIEVTEMELNDQEAEFLRLYRNATPEGKARIMAKAGVMAEEARARKGTVKEVIAQAVKPSKDPVHHKLKMGANKVKPEAMELPDLPKDFFKLSTD